MSYTEPKDQANAEADGNCFYFTHSPPLLESAFATYQAKAALKDQSGPSGGVLLEKN